MQVPKSAQYFRIILTGLFLCAGLSFQSEAQIKIGTNGATIAPSSILELESSNQGLLLTRLADTAAINALNPPNGMLIYLTRQPAVGLYVRKVGGWEFITGSMGGNGNFNSLTVAQTVTAGSFSGPLNGNATSANTALSANVSLASAITNDLATANPVYPVFATQTPGNVALRTSTTQLSFIPNTGILTARGFAGDLVGNVAGNATSATDAVNASNTDISDDVVSPTVHYPTFVSGTDGDLPQKTSSTNLSFIPQTGELTAPRFRGALIGNASSATNVTGVVAAVNGGTGHANFSPGDLLYAATSATIQRLPIGTNNTVLRVAGGLPTWSTAGAGTVTNVSGVANRINVIDNSINPIVDISPAYIGQPSITTVGTITTGTWNGGIIPATSGGTGANGFNANEVLVGSGTGNPIASIPLAGTAGRVLTSNGPGALPSFEAPGIGDMILASDQVVTGPKRFVDGSLLVRGTATGETTLRVDPNTIGVATFPAGSYTLVGTTGIQTISDKTFASGTTFNGTTTLNVINNTSQTATGNITAGSFSGPLTGNVTGNATTATSFTGMLAGDVNGAQTSTSVATVGGETAANIAMGVIRANTATAVATPNTLVARDINGDFAADQITATGGLVGNASTATALQNSRQVYGQAFNGTTDLNGVIGGVFGGTGINNGGRTISVEGNFNTFGANDLILRTTAATDLTLPTAGTLVASFSGSGIVSFPLSSPMGTSATGVGTIAVAGAVDGEPVVLGVPNAAMAFGNYVAWVSGPNVVSVRYTNTTGFAQTPGAITFNVKILR